MSESASIEQFTDEAVLGERDQYQFLGNLKSRIGAGFVSEIRRRSRHKMEATGQPDWTLIRIFPWNLAFGPNGAICESLGRSPRNRRKSPTKALKGRNRRGLNSAPLGLCGLVVSRTQGVALGFHTVGFQPGLMPGDMAMGEMRIQT